ncbi:MAG: fatty acid desaturase [Cyanobacteria bacterium P01_E01_bin.45]
MDIDIQKSDFILKPYMERNNLRATIQILNTVIPYFLLWVLAVKSAELSLWLLPPIILLLTLFSGRCFSLMHDCGHYSLFRSKRVNRIVGFCLGIINAIPQYPWSRGHAYHHKTNGDWERYRGPSGLISTQEFSQLTPFAKKRYAILRHPLMLFPGGFFYLAIKPRLALLLGSLGFCKHILSSFKPSQERNPLTAIASYESKYWYTAAEFWDLLFNNICVIACWVLCSHLLGGAFFLSIYSVVLACSAALFIYVFFVQHNFEGSYAHTTEGWSYLKGALEGSSYLDLPGILNWFTADIGYHNIHHLSERIPNYNLAACHHANSHLLSNSKRLQLQDLLNCSKFILWDSAAKKLVSIHEFQQQAHVPSAS